MVEELDIWRTAQLLIQHHGENALLEACQRADRMIESGNPGGEEVWKRVCEAVKELQRIEAPNSTN